MDGLMEGTENSEGRESHKSAGRGWENRTVSLLVNDLLIFSPSENAVSDLGREKISTEDCI